MTEITEKLLQIRAMGKLYEQMCDSVCQRVSLTRRELDVLAFLKNNPNLDTAREIEEYRMIPKSNISQAVDALVKKGLLRRTADEKDRRCIHLVLTDAAQPLLADILDMQQRFVHVLNRGLSEKEIKEHEKINNRIAENVQTYLRDGKETENDLVD